MAIETACPRCDRVFSFADDKDGKTVRCKECGERFVVEAMKPRRTKADSGRPPRKPGKGKKRAGSGNALLWVLAGGGLVLVLLAGGIGLFFVLRSGGGVGGVGGLGRAARVNEEAFDELRTGMTEEECIAVLGPATTRKVGPDNPHEAPKFTGPGIKVVDLVRLIWQSGKNKIEITFDANGKARHGKGVFVDAEGGTRELLGNNFDQLTLGDQQTVFYKGPDGNYRQPQRPKVAPGPSRVTMGKAFSLKKGMSSDEVVRQLGEEPTKKLGPQLMPDGTRSADTWQWSNGNGTLKVHFDANRKVIATKDKDLPVN
jgi:DNA-directed RNA polymerase subunit RPC12/RpoP